MICCNFLLCCIFSFAELPSSDANTWSAIAAIAQAVIALVAIGLTWALWKIDSKRHDEQRNHDRLSLEKSIRDGWIQIDLAIAQDPNLLRVMDGVFHPKENGPTTAAGVDGLDPSRKRWVAYAMLNVLIDRRNAAELLGSSAREARGGQKEICKAVDETLELLLNDSDIVEIVEKGGYELKFKQLCASKLGKKFDENKKRFV